MFVVWSSLFVVGCGLLRFVALCVVFVVRCALFVERCACLRFVVCRLFVLYSVVRVACCLSLGCYSLFAICRLLFVVCCLLIVECCV